ncbi:MAG TPA: NACHT domain-containing protein, partial [Blastocatellia bacterium]
MFDPNTEIVSKVAVNIITEVFKSCFSGLREAEAWVKDKSKEYDPLHKAARKYAERFEARYNSMRIFGMSNPVPLRNIYTRVNVLEKITARYRTTIQEMEKQYNRDLRSFGHVQKTKDGIHAVNHLDKIILLGKPGAGKTTFLKYIAFQALDGVLNKQRIPVFIRLKDWSDSNVSLINFIIGQFDICGFPSAGPFV